MWRVFMTLGVQLLRPSMVMCVIHIVAEAVVMPVQISHKCAAAVSFIGQMLECQRTCGLAARSAGIRIPAMTNEQMNAAVVRNTGLGQVCRRDMQIRTLPIAKIPSQSILYRCLRRFLHFALCLRFATSVPRPAHPAQPLPAPPGRLSKAPNALSRETGGNGICRRHSMRSCLKLSRNCYISIIEALKTRSSENTSLLTVRVS